MCFPRPLSHVRSIEKRTGVGQSIPSKRGEWKVLAKSISGLSAKTRDEASFNELDVLVKRFDALDGCWSAASEMGAVRDSEQGCQSDVRALDEFALKKGVECVMEWFRIEVGRAPGR
jgi:hypothetical protein